MMIQVKMAPTLILNKKIFFKKVLKMIKNCEKYVFFHANFYKKLKNCPKIVKMKN